MVGRAQRGVTIGVATGRVVTVAVCGTSRALHAAVRNHLLVCGTKNRITIGIARLGVVPFRIGFPGHAVEAFTVEHMLVDEAQGFVDADASFAGPALVL